MPISFGGTQTKKQSVILGTEVSRFQGSLLQRPNTVMLAQANVSQKVGGYDTRRLKVLVQNLGPGNVWVTTEDLSGAQDGYQLAPLATYEDDPPCHKGPYYFVTDTANTKLVVGFYQ